MRPNPTKRGFNLIEIAIVLAVIGLVIGGIYVAASAVTENNRRNTMKNLLITIVSNVRSTYATQKEFVAPGYAATRAMNIFPASAIDEGGRFVNPWGGDMYLETAANRQTFGIHSLRIPKTACTELLVSLFGSSRSTSTALLKTAHVQSVDVHDAHPNGITPSQAAALCDTNSNEMVFDYFLH